MENEDFSLKDNFTKDNLLHLDKFEDEILSILIDKIRPIILENFKDRETKHIDCYKTYMVIFGYILACYFWSTTNQTNDNTAAMASLFAEISIAALELYISYREIAANYSEASL